MLTTFILTKNDQKTVENTLQSIQALGCKIVVGDIGSTDNTINICRKFTSDIFVLKEGSYSAIRNKLQESTEGWIFWINPWETLTNHNEILSLIKKEPKNYRFQIMRGNLITKEIRLWHSSQQLKFENPVFETVFAQGTWANTVIYSLGETVRNDALELIEKWKEQSMTEAVPWYYEASVHLTNKDFDRFINAAEKFVFLESQTMAGIMMKYYLAIVYLHVKKLPKKASAKLMACLLKNPLMAEFWCLLGDIYYQSNQYERARHFYENAKILGQRRLTNDSWPVEINKYEDYPNKMIDSCRNILKQTKAFQAK